MTTRIIKIYAFSFLCILGTLPLNSRLLGQPSQSFGLGFYNNETEQDRRTSLDLTPEQALCFRRNIDLSFDLSFLPGHSNSFGYILRLVRNNTQNIDLLFDRVRFTEGNFRMVIGDKPPSASFTLDSNRLFNAWTAMRMTVDFYHDR